MTVLGSLAVGMLMLATEQIDLLVGIGLAALSVVTVGVLEAMRRVRRALSRPSGARGDLEAARGLMPLLAWPLVIAFAPEVYESLGWKSYIAAGAFCVTALGWLAAVLTLGDALNHLCPACGAFWDPEDDVFYLTSLCPQCARSRAVESCLGLSIVVRWHAVLPVVVM